LALIVIVHLAVEQINVMMMMVNVKKNFRFKTVCNGATKTAKVKKVLLLRSTLTLWRCAAKVLDVCAEVHW